MTGESNWPSVECPNCHGRTPITLSSLRHARYFTCPTCYSLMTSEQFAEAIRAAEAAVPKFSKDTV